MGTREENMFVWEGSQVQIRCLVQNTVLDNLGKMIWYKNGEHIDKTDPFIRNIVFQLREQNSNKIYCVFVEIHLIIGKCFKLRSKHI